MLCEVRYGDVVSGHVKLSPSQLWKLTFVCEQLHCRKSPQSDCTTGEGFVLEEGGRKVRDGRRKGAEGGVEGSKGGRKEGKKKEGGEKEGKRRERREEGKHQIKASD